MTFLSSLLGWVIKAFSLSGITALFRRIFQPSSLNAVMIALGALGLNVAPTDAEGVKMIANGVLAIVGGFHLLRDSRKGESNGR